MLTKQAGKFDFRYRQNTGQEFDGSDSGARPDEAISWGKIRAGSESVKVISELFTPTVISKNPCIGFRGRHPSIPPFGCSNIR